MDSDDPRRRPVQLPGYSQSASQHQQNSNHGQTSAQQPTIMQTATTPSQFHATHAGYGHGYGYHEVGRTNDQALQSGFAEQSIDYNRSGNIPRSPQPQYYQQGVQNMVYTMPQSQSYQYQWYGPVTPTQPRHFRPAVSGELGVAQQTYYSSGVPSVSTPTMSIPNTATATHDSQYYTPTSQQAMTNSYESFQQPNPGMNDDGAQGTIMDTTQSPDSPTARRTAAFARYHDLLRQTLESAKDDRLKEAAHGLSTMSRELLGNVQRLGRNTTGSNSRTQLLTQPAGLVFDDLPQREFRLTLWNNFNHAWLAVLQKQKEISQAELSGTEKLELPKSRIPRATLKEMGDQLMSLCDEINEWGLVDYEMGVWEEQIIDLLCPCLEIAIKLDKTKPGSGSTASKGPKQVHQNTTSTSGAGPPVPKSPGGKRK